MWLCLWISYICAAEGRALLREIDCDDAGCLLVGADWRKGPVSMMEATKYVAQVHSCVVVKLDIFQLLQWLWWAGDKIYVIQHVLAHLCMV